MAHPALLTRCPGAALLLGLALCACDGGDRRTEVAGPSLRLEHSEVDGTVVGVAVEGLAAESLSRFADLPGGDAAWHELLAIYTGSPERPPLDRSAVIGTYSLDRGSLLFLPRFPFAAGLTLTAFSPGRTVAGAADVPSSPARLTFSIRESGERAETRVTAIYPSTPRVPANLLRFYVHFSAPMRGRGVPRHVHLFELAGTSAQEVPLPFVEIDQGLWDPSHRRLTLFLHPGRIKRGVAPREELGPVLQPGRRYRLQIDGELPDAAGLPLAESFEWSFTAGQEDRTRPEAAQVRVVPPQEAGGPLTVELPEPLDRALLLRWIEVSDGEGHRLDGEVQSGAGERRWLFSPATPWRDGSYVVRLHSALEDLAGNTFDRLFDAAGPAEESGAPKHLEIPFELRLSS